MEVNSYKSEGDEIFEDTYDNDISELLSPANLDIEEDEWNLLIRTDQELAAQIGYFLLKRNKSLELLLTTTETCAEEHKIRANHYEKQIRYMRESMEAQSKSYDTFEKQVDDLTVSYQRMSEECRQYKERNKGLWEIVASLEERCEDYLVELELLKSSRMFDKDEIITKEYMVTGDMFSCTDETPTTGDDNCSTVSRNSSIDGVDQWESDIVSLKVFAEETSRKHDIERCQRLNCEFKLERACAENKDLRHHILFLQHRLKSQINEVMPQDENDCQLTRAKSMNSLPINGDEKINSNYEVNNNIRFEVEQCNVYEEDNHSIRELFQRFNHKTEENIENNLNSQNKMHLLSPIINPGARRTSDIYNPICNACKSKMTVRRDSPLMSRRDSRVAASSKHENKTGGGDNTVANYRDMFAQIFEKLKISRDDAPASY